MDNRPGSALDDAALERGIEHALAVEPSPEFLARVRTRISNEPVPARWIPNWPLLMTASAMAAIVVAAIVMRPGNQEPRGSTDASTLASRPLIAPVATLAPGTVLRPSIEAASVPRQATVRVGEPVNQVHDTEVLLARDETATLRRLVRGISSARVVATSTVPDLPAVVVVADIRAMSEIVVAPLAPFSSVNIEPLAPVREEGVRQ